jgi:hypothetical protein
MEDEDDRSDADVGRSETDDGRSDAEVDRSETDDGRSDAEVDRSQAEGGWSDADVGRSADGDDRSLGDHEDDHREGNVAGTLAPDVPVEPGRPDLRNAVFVGAGAYVGMLAIAALIGFANALSLVDYATITGVFLALAGGSYGLLARTNPDT